MTLSIYSVTHDFMAALNELEKSSGELTKELVGAAVKSLPADTEANIAAFCKNIEEECAVIASHEKRLNDKRLFLERRLAAYKGFLLSKMQENNISKIECDEFFIQIKKNPPALIIEDESQIPISMYRVKTEVDKDAIKKALRNGEFIDGVRLESKERIEIKGRGE